MELSGVCRFSHFPHAGGAIGLLPGTVNQVGDAVGAGKPKGRTELPDRDSVNSTDRGFVAMAISTLGQSDHPAEKVFAPKYPLP